MSQIAELVYGQDVINTLFDPALQKIHFKIGTFTINPSDYVTIRNLIATNRIEIGYRAMSDEDLAIYSPGSDRLIFDLPDAHGSSTDYRAQYREIVNFSRLDNGSLTPSEMDELASAAITRRILQTFISKPHTRNLQLETQEVIVHECTHAIIDWFNFEATGGRVSVPLGEGAAYIAAKVFMLERSRVIETGRSPRFIALRPNVIERIARTILTNHYYEVSAAELVEIRRYLQGFIVDGRPVYNVNANHQSNGVWANNRFDRAHHNR